LGQSVFDKAAVNYVVMDRLYSFGLGPEPLGFAIAKEFVGDENINGVAVGVAVRNI